MACAFNLRRYCNLIPIIFVIRYVLLRQGMIVCLPVCCSKNIKITSYRTTTFPVFCMGVKLGRSLREEIRLRVSENRVLRRIFVLRETR